MKAALRGRMPRTILPAFGKALLDRRRKGDHPITIALIFGDDWKAYLPVGSDGIDGNSLPLIALKPEDYAPGRYDWHLVAGLRIQLYDQHCCAWDSAGPFYSLLGELLEWRTFVDILWPEDSSWAPMSACMLARSLARYDSELKRFAWPSWWSDDIDRMHKQRWNLWYRDLVTLTHHRDDLIADGHGNAA